MSTTTAQTTTKYADEYAEERYTTELSDDLSNVYAPDSEVKGELHLQ